MSKNYLVIGAIALAFVITAVTVVGAQVSLKEMIAEIAGREIAREVVGETEVVDMDFGAFPGTDITEKVTFHSGYTEGARVFATTTQGTSATLVGTDLTNSEYHRVLLGGAIASGGDFTYTLPASTSLRSYVPRIGDRTRHCWFLYGTTTDSNLIFAAGTGVDFRYASSTSAVAAVPSLQSGVGQEACMEFIRQPDDGGGNGDITAILEILSEAD